ncbi:DUF2892 domain-containing protein [Halorubellus sp. JP-L1]|uniref:YgaP family membrane protein n=1 Tax=Halorubellus sp. JP-L1 TaxID=2715753 RepID=UPI00140AF2A4|nr:DUF2892 domain-containing protein [Halorubellus sp. JP-L1]NHN43350.1 DUF2892 domain-containing protein [Halorubellus sp. JP-L1]
MEQNVGRTDGIGRVVLGGILGVVSLAILADAVGGAPVVLSPVLGALSLILLVTGATNTCGVYSLLGIDTSQ